MNCMIQVTFFFIKKEEILLFNRFRYDPRARSVLAYTLTSDYRHLFIHK